MNKNVNLWKRKCYRLMRVNMILMIIKDFSLNSLNLYNGN